MVKRRFTPAEAARALPLVRRIVEDVLASGRELQGLAARPSAPGNRERAGALQARLAELEQELARIGCSYKGAGFEHGLIDFPGELDGREVLWCWKSDEAALGWYHAPEDGFAGRKPIPPELLPTPTE